MSKTYHSIQALRFFAAFLVLAMHAGLYASERLDASYSRYIWDAGSTGVDIFFIISGFVITISSRRLLHVGDGWRTFALRRILRVVPLYWILMTAKLFITAVIPSAALHSTFEPYYVIASYLFLPAKGMGGAIFPYLGVGWTLNFEFLFYFIFGSALFFGLNVFKTCLVVFSLLGISSLLKNPSLPAISFYFDAIVLEFLFGMLLAKYVAYNPLVNIKIALALIILGAGFILMPPNTLSGLPRFLWRGVPALALVAGFVFLEQNIGNITPRWLSFLGDSSYALYLSHPFIAPLAPILLYGIGVKDIFLSMSASIVMSIGVACVVWAMVDRPIYTNLTRRFLIGRG